MSRRFYLSINTRPREALHVMSQITKDLSRYRGDQRVAWMLAIGLCVTGLAFWIVDTAMGYSGPTFVFVAYLLWGGAAFLIGYTLVSMLIRRPHILQGIGTFILAAFFMLTFFLIAWSGGEVSARTLLILIGIVALIIVIYISEKATHLPRGQMGTARRILHTLRDDVAHNGRITGWLDLSGAQQKSKLLRTGRSSSGNVKHYYRDPWLSAKIKLVDGNLLRLTLIERVKVKEGIAEKRYQLKAKLAVNSQVYDVGSGSSMRGLTQSGNILQLQLDKHGPFTASQVLAHLKAMYDYLHPRQPVVPGA